MFLCREFCNFADYGFSPEFQLQPVSTAVLLGHDLLLDCHAVLADPGGNTISESVFGLRILYDWSFNGRRIAEAKTKAAMFTNHSLYVPKMAPDDLGTYQCVVSPDGVQVQITSSRNATVVKACK